MPWTTDELNTIGATEEIRIARTRSLAERGVRIWVVRVGDGLYVRSWKGASGHWYRRAVTEGTARISAASVEREVRVTVPPREVDDAVDRAYRTKYGRYGDTYLRPMIAAAARATTLRLDAA